MALANPIEQNTRLTPGHVIVGESPKEAISDFNDLSELVPGPWDQSEVTIGDVVEQLPDNVSKRSFFQMVVDFFNRF